MPITNSNEHEKVAKSRVLGKLKPRVLNHSVKRALFDAVMFAHTVERGPVRYGAEVDVYVKDEYYLGEDGKPLMISGKVMKENEDGTLQIEYAEDCWHTRKERSTMEKDIIGMRPSSDFFSVARHASIGTATRPPRTKRRVCASSAAISGAPGLCLE